MPKTKYTYPPGTRPWMIEPFPIDLRKRIVVQAKKEGKTTPALVEEICLAYLQNK